MVIINVLLLNVVLQWIRNVKCSNSLTYFTLGMFIVLSSNVKKYTQTGLAVTPSLSTYRQLHVAGKSCLLHFCPFVSFRVLQGKEDKNEQSTNVSEWKGRRNLPTFQTIPCSKLDRKSFDFKISFIYIARQILHNKAQVSFLS